MGASAAPNPCDTISEGKGRLKSWVLCDGLRDGVMGQGPMCGCRATGTLVCGCVWEGEGGPVRVYLGVAGSLARPYKALVLR